MATPEEREQKHQEVEGLLDELSNVSTESLGRRLELSPDINFEDVVPDFEKMLDVVKQLHDRDITRLPTTELDRIKKGLTPLQQVINEVQAFSLQQENPHTACDNIKARIQKMYDDLMSHTMASLAFTATQSTDYDRIEREAKGVLADVKDTAKEFQSTLQQQKEDAQKALEAVQEQAAKAGVSAHSKNYHDQAFAHEKAGKGWFVATVVAASATLLAAVAGLVAVFFYTPQTPSEAIQYVAAKIVVLAVLWFAIIWCSKNYRSEKHNETLNRHRANSLGTFQTFTEGTSDGPTKDAILVFCAQSAFGHQPTGYEKDHGKDGEPQIVNPVIDILGKQGATQN